MCQRWQAATVQPELQSHVMRLSAKRCVMVEHDRRRLLVERHSLRLPPLRLPPLRLPPLRLPPLRLPPLRFACSAKVTLLSVPPLPATPTPRPQPASAIRV